jgi:CRP/FNR family transcriptional regulator, cyclic AMP receptor protein
MLSLTVGLPEIDVAAGDVVVAEGEVGGSLWILVSGRLAVSRGGIDVNAVVHPGSVIGEVAVLLGGGYSATVTAVEPTRLRYAADGAALLDEHAALAHLVAVGLAERLAFVTTYLSDLQHQYADTPGLAMVGDVLRRLGERTGPRAEPGSMRDPDPPY